MRGKRYYRQGTHFGVAARWVMQGGGRQTSCRLPDCTAQPLQAEGPLWRAQPLVERGKRSPHANRRDAGSLPAAADDCTVSPPNGPCRRGRASGLYATPPSKALCPVSRPRGPRGPSQPQAVGNARGWSESPADTFTSAGQGAVTMCMSARRLEQEGARKTEQRHNRRRWALPSVRPTATPFKRGASNRGIKHTRMMCVA